MRIAGTDDNDIKDGDDVDIDGASEHV